MVQGAFLADLTAHLGTVMENSKMNGQCLVVIISFKDLKYTIIAKYVNT